MKAPEFKGVIAWLNAKPLTVQALKGKVVLIDFWTYTCVNCIRTLPGLRKLWSEYKDKGLVIIGIHTPEFEIEKNIDNIKVALKKHGITWPIAVDSDYAMWNAYNNHYWPRHYLIDQEGNIVWDHAGEGGEAEMEGWIRKLLDLPPKKLIEHPQRYGAITPETYCGSARNEGLGSGKVCTPQGCDRFVDPGKHYPGVVYLDGEWKQEPEFVEGTGHIVLNYRSREANLVMDIDKPGEVEVFIDDKPIPKLMAGKEIVYKEGKSFVKVAYADMYNLISSKEIQQHDIKLKPTKPIRCYAWTFG